MQFFDSQVRKTLSQPSNFLPLFLLHHTFLQRAFTRTHAHTSLVHSSVLPLSLSLALSVSLPLCLCFSLSLSLSLCLSHSLSLSVPLSLSPRACGGPLESPRERGWRTGEERGLSTKRFVLHPILPQFTVKSVY